MTEQIKVKSFSAQDLKKLKQEFASRIEAEVSKPFIVAIMGQTGVGKSSLINALFNTKLQTDPLRPCTQEIECVVAENEAGHQLWFYDLPGIGESEDADAKYVQQYRQILIESDVVLWAILADSRSVSLDFKVLRQVLDSPQEQQSQLISKITVVLTKADLLTPDPWILAISQQKDSAYFYPRPKSKTEKNLSEKSAYYQQLFSNFSQSVKSSKIDYQFQAIPCSAKFRYNLPALMLEVIKKMQEEAVLRFDKFYKNEPLNELSPSAAKKFRNFVMLDLDQEKL